MEQASQIGTLAVLFVVGVAGGQLATMEKKQYIRTIVCEASSQRKAIITSITTLEQALKVRDQYTRQHSDNTAELAVELAQRLGLDEERREDIYLAALMHDVGKIGVRDDILLKPDSLTKEEWEKIKEHPNIAEEILKPITGVEPVVDIVRAHHEHYDGSGYPRGLKGDAIPLGAQILAIADTYSALTEDRQYHEGEDFDRALQVMDTMAGRKLNPEILETFKNMIIEKCGARA
jgi:putative nucleotidyltransferase with HDIG domain